MKVVHDRADARWLPSRFHLALFRLLAFFRLKTSRPQPHPGLALAIERHQDAAENYLDGACTFIVIAAYVTSLLISVLPVATASLIAVPATALYFSGQTVFVGFVIAPIVRRFTRTNDGYGIAINSAIFLIVTIACATLLAVSISPLRYVGFAYLVLVAANAVAAVIVFLMQRPIENAERSYGVEP